MLFSEKQMIKHTYQQTKTFQEKSRDKDWTFSRLKVERVGETTLLI